MSPAPVLDLRDVAYDSPIAVELIEEIQSDLEVRYGSRDETPVDPADFALPAGVFVVASIDGTIVACAGLRSHGGDALELKRMYVRPQHRRRGVARALLIALEERARAMASARLVLETGTGQPEAIALYESLGYAAVPGFGFYRHETESRSYAKDL